MTIRNSLTEYLAKHAEEERASFHMPGHKGMAFFERLGYADAVKNAAYFDVTEIPGADDLRKSEGIIKTVSDKYAELYGSKRSFISVNGSSALIMAAIKTCVKPGHKIIAAADSHISVLNGIRLAGADAVFVEPERLVIRGAGAEAEKLQMRVASAETEKLQMRETSTGSECVQMQGEGADYLKAPGTIGRPVGDASAAIDNKEESGPNELLIPGGVSAKAIAEALDRNEDADAVILPSPNYFGVASDIRTIAEAVHKKGKILIVDQAHGAHLKMFAEAGFCERASLYGSTDGMMSRAIDEAAQNVGVLPMPADEAAQKGGVLPMPADEAAQKGGVLPMPAEECGADIVIDSTHKTMASFTQTAVVNLFGDRVDPEQFEQNLLMFESTSPSYVLMNSLAVNADIVEERGSELATTWKENLEYFYEQVKDIKGIRVLTRDDVRAASKAAAGAEESVRAANASGLPVSDFDETKIVVDFGGAGEESAIAGGAGPSGEQAEKMLIERGIYPEFHVGNVVMFLTGIGNDRADYEALIEALRDMVSR